MAILLCTQLIKGNHGRQQPSLPGVDEGHRAFARDLEPWTRDALPVLLTHEAGDLDSVYACVAGVMRALGRAGLLPKHRKTWTPSRPPDGDL